MLVLSNGRRVEAQSPNGFDAPISGDLSILSDAQLEERIRFLESRFGAGQRNAQLWQHGFTGAWASGAVIGTLQASLSSEPDNRVPAIVTAGKAVIGTTRLLLSPHPARLGVTPLDIDAADRRTTLEAQVAAGEKHLLQIDSRARGRKNWIAHAANFGLNAIGGGVIVGLGNPSDAISNVGVGILFGELMLWTMPARGERDLSDYRSVVRSGDVNPRSPKPRVAFAPTTTGVVMQVQF